MLERILNALRGKETVTTLTPPEGGTGFSIQGPGIGSDRRSELKAREAAAMREIDRLTFGEPEAKPAPAAITNPAAPADAWSQRFVRKPYFTPGNSFAVTAKIVHQIAALSGRELVTVAELDELRLCQVEIGKARAAMGDCTLTAVKHKLGDMLREADRSVASGEPPDLVESRAVLEDEAKRKLAQLKGTVRAYSVRAIKSVKPIGARLIEAAKMAAVKLDDLERANAAAWGLEFFPSFALVMCVWLAKDAVQTQLDNLEAFNTLRPSEIFWGAFSTDIEKI
jgi:hypothetical protein